jgi:hypothetical protein
MSSWPVSGAGYGRGDPFGSRVRSTSGFSINKLVNVRYIWDSDAPRNVLGDIGFRRGIDTDSNETFELVG